MLHENERFLTDWTRTKTTFIEHYFPNYEDPTWGQYREIALAGTIAKFSTLITDKQLAARARELSRQMVETAGQNGAAILDEGDICPPYYHVPHPHFGDGLEPVPNPWKEIPAAEQVEIAYLFTKFSALTTSQRFNGALKALATSIAAGAAGKLADEFEKCGTPPRPKREILQTLEV